MKLKFTILLCSLIVPSVAWGECDCGSTDQGNPCVGQSISTTVTASTVNGVGSVDSVFTWAFNSNSGDARCGQFANGDYWVAPASGETDVTITAITGSDSVSCDADPVLESMGLLDNSNNYGNYNVAENIVANLPVSYSVTTSLLAAIQRDEATTGDCGTSAIVGECADAYQVVTILDSVPANAGSTLLRPNITGESKVMLSLTDFDFSRIPSKSYLTGTDAAGYEAIRQRWSHSTEIFGMFYDVNSWYSEGGRAFRSHILIDDYSAGVAQQWNSDLMTIFSDEDPLAEKQAALAAMLSYGLDLYHDYFNAPVATTREWGQGAGQSLGRYLPPVFMSSLLVDTTYADNHKTVGSSTDTTGQDNGPHEMGQVHLSSGRSPIWGDYTGFVGVNFGGAYWDSLWKSQCYDGASGICNVNIGKKTQLDPYGYIDGPPNKPAVVYMLTTLGPQRGMVAVMALMPKVNDTVNYQPLADYVIALNDNGLDTADDPCVTPDSREDTGGACDPYRNENCVYYGVTWGPVDPTDMESDCIKTPTSTFTKVGRFIELDGDAVTPNYISQQVEDNWDAMMAEAGWETGSGTGISFDGNGSILLNGSGSIHFQ